MEQRIYRGTITPDELGDFLVQYFDPKPDIQAQKLGTGHSLIVQIGQGDVVEKIRHAVTVSITELTDGSQGVTVTMGEQHWFTPEMATHAAFWTLVGALVTPWALLVLLWPLSDMAGALTLSHSIWTEVDLFATGRGAPLAETTLVQHPHAEF